MHTEEEGIEDRPLEPEGEGLLDQVVVHEIHGNCRTPVV
jgi:hypothetical protein